ncbi:hypothetical protein KTP48_09780 [Proteus mirabilis]|nr:hypothetical protein [Proteus mirabilis]MBU9979031.1 hypothetical protein [Proteus mirabilis]MDX4950112.1 hypothetical protein [Proteus mirabilis]
MIKIKNDVFQYVNNSSLWLVPSLFILYFIFIDFFYNKKINELLNEKKTSVLDFIYIIIIMATGGAYLTIFTLGERFILGSLFISPGGNKDVITWSSLLFVFILAVFSSPNIKNNLLAEKYQFQPVSETIMY